MTRLPSVLRLVHPVADRAVLVGDPGRALQLAQSVLDGPRMSNHQRGLWGYTGTGADGRPLTVQSTGVGGPSAALVVAELAVAGVRIVVRAGTAMARPGAPSPDGPRAVGRAVGLDGASRALRRGGSARGAAPDPPLLEALVAGDGPAIVVASVDVVTPRGLDELPPEVEAVDLQTAAVLASAAVHGVRAAALVAFPDADETQDDAWTAASRDVGGRAAAALLEVDAADRRPDAVA